MFSKPKGCEQLENQTELSNKSFQTVKNICWIAAVRRQQDGSTQKILRRFL